MVVGIDQHGASIYRLFPVRHAHSRGVRADFCGASALPRGIEEGQGDKAENAIEHSFMLGYGWPTRRFADAAT
ncbi:hypothetical protein Pres01_00650 [Metapseudomonas resinovorans]|nr:hypothetical protein Pres01_00650 [Pseudomonas resinovorans]